MTTSTRILAILATLAIGTTALAQQGPASSNASGSSGSASSGSVGTSGSSGAWPHSPGTSGTSGSCTGSSQVGSASASNTGSGSTSSNTGTGSQTGTSGSSGTMPSCGTSGTSSTIASSGSNGSSGNTGSSGSTGTSGSSGIGSSIGTSGTSGSCTGSSAVGGSYSSSNSGVGGGGGGGGGGGNTLPTITTDCFLIEGCGLSGVTGVMFGTESLTMSGAFGEGSYKIVSDNLLKVCPPLCLDAGAYTITYSDVNGVMGQLEVNLVDPTEPTLACTHEHEVGTVQCNFVHTGGIEDVLIFTIISTELIPTIIPGLVQLEIGNQGTNYLCGPPLIGNCVKDTIGMIPLSAVGFTLHFQALFINPFTMVTPWPTTNACSTSYVN